MIPDGYDIVPINASPAIGDRVESVFPPDPLYVGRVWEILMPDVVLACGQVAQRAVSELGIEHIKAPHPAWRQLTSGIVDDVKERLARLQHA
jgi:hypothetical protein